MTTEMNWTVLTFKDRFLEKEYKAYNDYKNRYFIRFGKLFCLASWVAAIPLLLIYKPANYSISLYPVSINVAIVTIAIIVAFNKHAVHLYQPVIAFAVLTSMSATIAAYFFGTMSSCGEKSKITVNPRSIVIHGDL